LTIFDAVTIITPSRQLLMNVTHFTAFSYRYNANDCCLLHVLSILFILKEILSWSWSWLG